MNEPRKVVFDCNVFVQALANPIGPAGRCVDLALSGKVELFVSPHVIEEIREVTSRPKLIAKFKFRVERVEILLDSLLKAAVMVAVVPEMWHYERDPDDAHYVNLAIATNARLIVSRDQDLLALTDQTFPESRNLLAQYPDFGVLTPPQFLTVVDATPG